MAFLGVDLPLYPGDGEMQWLRTKAEFSVTGFYLGPTPGNPDTSWMPKLTTLAGQGWGFLPVYVGRRPNDPDIATSGGIDAVDAAYKGPFHQGHVIYLDVEGAGALPSDYAQYVQEWVTVLKAHEFIPGLRCSHTLLSWALGLTNKVWTLHAPPPPGGVVDPAHLPPGNLDPGACATRFLQDVRLTGGGPTTLNLDICLTADPSKP